MLPSYMIVSMYAPRSAYVVCLCVFCVKNIFVSYLNHKALEVITLHSWFYVLAYFQYIAKLLNEVIQGFSNSQA